MNENICILEELLSLSRQADSIIENAFSDAVVNDAFFEDTKARISEIITNKTPRQKTCQVPRNENELLKFKLRKSIVPFVQYRAHIHEERNKQNSKSSGDSLENICSQNPETSKLNKQKNPVYYVDANANNALSDANMNCLVKENSSEMSIQRYGLRKREKSKLNSQKCFEMKHEAVNRSNHYSDINDIPSHESLDLIEFSPISNNPCEHIEKYSGKKGKIKYTKIIKNEVHVSTKRKGRSNKNSENKMSISPEESKKNIDDKNIFEKHIFNDTFKINGDSSNVEISLNYRKPSALNQECNPFIHIDDVNSKINGKKRSIDSTDSHSVETNITASAEETLDETTLFSNVPDLKSASSLGSKTFSVRYNMKHYNKNSNKISNQLNISPKANAVEKIQVCSPRIYNLRPLEKQISIEQNHCYRSKTCMKRKGENASFGENGHREKLNLIRKPSMDSWIHFPEEATSMKGKDENVSVGIKGHTRNLNQKRKISSDSGVHSFEDTTCMKGKDENVLSDINGHSEKLNLKRKTFTDYGVHFLEENNACCYRDYHNFYKKCGVVSKKSAKDQFNAIQYESKIKFLNKKIFAGEHSKKVAGKKIFAKKNFSRKLRTESEPVRRAKKSNINKILSVYTPVKCNTLKNESLKVKTEEKRKLREMRMQKTKERRERLEKERQEKIRLKERRLEERFQQREEMLKKKAKKFKIKSQGRQKNTATSYSPKDYKDVGTKDSESMSSNDADSGQKLSKESNGYRDAPLKTSCLTSEEGNAGLIPEIAVEQHAILVGCEETPTNFLGTDNSVKNKKAENLSESQEGVKKENLKGSSTKARTPQRISLLIENTNTSSNKENSVIPKPRNYDNPEHTKKDHPIYLEQNINKTYVKKKIIPYLLRSGQKKIRDKVVVESTYNVSPVRFCVGINEEESSKRKNVCLKSSCNIVNPGPKEISNFYNKMCFKYNNSETVRKQCLPRNKKFSFRRSSILTRSQKRFARCPFKKNRKCASFNAGAEKKEPISYNIPEVRNDSFEEYIVDPNTIPTWATGIYLKQALLQQYYKPPNVENIFGTVKNETVDLVSIFERNRPEYHQRTSSNEWNTSFS